MNSFNRYGFTTGITGVERNSPKMTGDMLESVAKQWIYMNHNVQYIPSPIITNKYIMPDARCTCYDNIRIG